MAQVHRGRFDVMLFGAVLAGLARVISFFAFFVGPAAGWLLTAFSIVPAIANADGEIAETQRGFPRTAASRPPVSTTSTSSVVTPAPSCRWGRNTGSEAECSLRAFIETFFAFPSLETGNDELPTYGGKP